MGTFTLNKSLTAIDCINKNLKLCSFYTKITISNTFEGLERIFQYKINPKYDFAAPISSVWSKFNFKITKDHQKNFL